MNQAETEFLALVALGMFTIDSRGQIWRHKEWTKGSHLGSEPALIPLQRIRRADVSGSGLQKGRKTSYRRVMFMAKGKRWKVQAHRMVWMIHNGEPIPTGLEINHMNGRGEDNSPENLEVVTTSQNITHAIRVLGAKRKAQYGSLNPSTNLTEAQVAEIKKLAELKSMPHRKIAEMFGVKQQTVSNIHTGKTWKHVVLTS